MKCSQLLLLATSYVMPSISGVALQEKVWRSRASDHVQRIHGLFGGISPVEAATSCRHNPIFNFIFTYYFGYKPSDLTRWSPGAHIELSIEGDVSAVKQLLARADWAVKPNRSGKGSRIFLDMSVHRGKKLQSLKHAHNTLVATSRRLPVRTCFGFHEWAMLYDSSGEHSAISGRFQKDLPLRVTQSELNAVVEAPGALQCSHFDAFRFFSDGAKPKNLHTGLSRERQDLYEQPGCVHATMDLFKYALRLAPMLPSELLADALAIAIEARVLDMRASPYDLTAAFTTDNDLGIDPSPVMVETQSGRKQYAELQFTLACKAAPIRRALIEAYERYFEAARYGSGFVGSTSQ